MAWAAFLTQIALCLIKTLNDEEQFHVKSIEKFWILINSLLTHQKVLELGHTGQNPIRQLIHKQYLIILDHNYSLLQGLKQLFVRVTLRVRKLGLS